MKVGQPENQSFKMDFLLPHQLHKYEDVIEAINQEFKKGEQLEELLNNENNKILVFNLSTSTLNQKISHVGVKVFSNILDIFILYEDELKIDMKQFVRYTSHKFYLIEAYITKAILQKIPGKNCILNICIRCGDMNINKSIKITSNSASPLLEIIPVDENVVNCAIEATILTDQSLIIKLDEVLVDISYHFQVYDKKRKMNSRVHSILQVAKRYNEDLALRELNEKLILDYELRCNIDTKEFISIIIKNSYHHLGSDLFTELISSDKNYFTMYLHLGLNKCEIIYKDSKICLKATLIDLLMLKKYFRGVIEQSGVTCDNVEGLPAIQKLKDTIPLRIEDIRLYYNNLRKCWSSLPTCNIDSL